MITYKIGYSSSSFRFLKKINIRDQKRIIKKIKELLNNTEKLEDYLDILYLKEADITNEKFIPLKRWKVN
jgi:mRNA-degrading endonuclease RelE of RelBE toxin-antitoxin system